MSQRDLFRQYTQVLRRIAREGPLLLLVDDLQWADNASISLLFHLGQALRGYPILLIGAFRPADIFMGRSAATLAQWERHPLAPLFNEFQRRYGEIGLDLGRADGRRFVTALLDLEPHRLGPAYQGALFEHTGGHPLFTIETLRSMQGRGDLVRDHAGRWVEGESVDWERLPARVEGVVRERVARLPAALRRIMSAASVEGMAFPTDVIARAVNMEEEAVLAVLGSDACKQSNLLQPPGTQRRGDRMVTQYTFRHALFQTFLYHEQDQAQRAQWHERIGEALEKVHGAHLEPVAGRLARHFAAAGLNVRAAGYFLTAGDTAVRLVALDEAVANYERGLSLLADLPETPERDQLELRLQVALGAARTFITGPTAGATLAAHERALSLGKRLDDTSMSWQPLYGLWLANFFGNGAHTRGQALAEELLHLATGLADPEPQLIAHRLLGTTLFYQGQGRTAVGHLERAVALYDRRRHAGLVYRYGHDPGVMSLAYLALSLWWLGQTEEALQRDEASRALAHELDHPVTRGFALLMSAILHQVRGEPAPVRQLAQELHSLISAHRLQMFAVQTTFLEGWALVKLGQKEKGQRRLRRAEGDYPDTGAMRLTYYPMIVEGHLAAGDVAAGMTAVAKALAIVDQKGERWCEAELYRLRGELKRLQPAAPHEAEHDYRKAIAIAAAQGARPYLERAEASLARLPAGPVAR